MVEWSRDIYVNPHSQVTPDFNPIFKKSSQVLILQSNLSSDHKRDEKLKKSSSNTDLVVKDNIEQIQNLKQQKEILEHGIELFNKKPKKGLTFLQSHGLVGPELSDVAEFLHKDDERLDRTVIGNK